MKLLKFIFIFVLFPAGAFAQSSKEDNRFYYKDTLFEFYGAKVEVRRCFANDEIFKCNIVITNNSDQFMIFDPAEIFSAHAQSDAEFPALNKRKVVVAPKYSKAFYVKFENKDFRQSYVVLNVKAIQMTDKVIAVYQISDFDLHKDQSKTNGPITWELLKTSEEDKKPHDDYRVDGRLTYTGNKFLAIYYNNIILKTNDKKTYVNEGKASSTFSFVRNKFYYDNSKHFEKQLLSFPVESGTITPELNPSLNFDNVFKEYSLTTIEGFKVRLTKGTISDYEATKNNEKDIEEAE